MVEEMDWQCVLNSMTIYLFARGIFTKDLILRCFNALGKPRSAEELIKLGRKFHRLKFEIKE